MNSANDKLRAAIAREAARLVHAGVESTIAGATRRALRLLGRGRTGGGRMARRETPAPYEVERELERFARASSDTEAVVLARRLEVLAALRALRGFAPVVLGDLSGREWIDRPALIDVQAALDAVGMQREIESALLAEGLEVRPAGGGTLAVGSQGSVSVRIVPAAGRVHPGLGLEAYEAALAADLPWLDLDSEAQPGRPAGGARRETIAGLVRGLEEFKLDRRTHPEGDALFHSLQLFDRITRDVPYDGELAAAALLHLVGKPIDRVHHVDAALEVLEGLVPERTRWFIASLPVAMAQQAGDRDALERAGLARHEDRPALEALARADQRARVPGIAVTALDSALAWLDELGVFDDDDPEE